MIFGVAGFLRSLNEAYSKAVTEDKEVNDGGLLESWNPLSHCSYWTSESAIATIADGLHGILQQLESSDFKYESSLQAV